MKSRLSHLQCAGCARELPVDQLQQRCPECSGTLLARYDFAGLDLEQVRSRPAGTWRYRELLPVQKEPVSLGEPETGLIYLERLSRRWGVEAWLKDDSTLPGGTFKARGACVGLSRAVELGAKRLVMPSAGNAGGAWSLYAARARLPITVTMAETAPETNQLEVRAAGGDLVLVPGSIADAGAKAKEIAERQSAFLVTTFSEPYRLEGKKAAWFELFDRLGDDHQMRMPRTIVLPVGGGVAAIAAAKAADEVRALGWTDDEVPRLVGVQARNCAPLATAFDEGADGSEPWAGDPHTIAAGLRVPAPAEGPLVLATIRQSGGRMHAVGEHAIGRGIRAVAATEGIFCCPEGAAAVVAADQLAADGLLEGPVVVYNTGSGLKYLDIWESLPDLT